MNRRTKIALSISVIYLVAFLAYLIGVEASRKAVFGLNPSNFGDVLAGLAAPLAFLWLVIGYFQQGEELQLQRAELRLQREEVARLANEAAKQAGAAQSSVLMTVFEFLSKEETREARTHAIRVLGTKPYQQWNDDDRRFASLVCASFDVAAIYVRNSLVQKEICLENWHVSATKCYEAVKAYVDDMRRPEKSGTGYWKNFVWLYDECRKWGRQDTLG